MAFCRSCGTELAGHGRFCAACGTVTDPPAGSAPGSAKARGPAEAALPPLPTQRPVLDLNRPEPPAPGPTRSRVPLLVAVLVVVAVGAGLLVGLLLVGDSEDPQTAETAADAGDGSPDDGGGSDVGTSTPERTTTTSSTTTTTTIAVIPGTNRYVAPTFVAQVPTALTLASSAPPDGRPQSWVMTFTHAPDITLKIDTTPGYTGSAAAGCNGALSSFGLEPGSILQACTVSDRGGREVAALQWTQSDGSVFLDVFFTDGPDGFAVVADTTADAALAEALVYQVIDGVQSTS